MNEVLIASGGLFWVAVCYGALILYFGPHLDE